MGLTNRQIATELLVVSKEKLKFLAAHVVEQWWPSDAELQQVIHNSNLISWQLSFLYTITPKEVYHLFNPSFVSLIMQVKEVNFLYKIFLIVK